MLDAIPLRVAFRKPERLLVHVLCTALCMSGGGFMWLISLSFVVLMPFRVIPSLLVPFIG